MSAVKKESEYGSKGVRKILVGALKRAEVVRPFYRIIVEDLDTTRDDVLNPQYWAHCSEMFNRDTHVFAIIELVWQDASKMMQVMVVSAGANFAKVKEIQFVDFSADEKDAFEYTDENPDFKVEYRGGARWTVIRLADNQVLIEKLSSRLEAEKWLDDHMKAMNA